MFRLLLSATSLQVYDLSRESLDFMFFFSVIIFSRSLLGIAKSQRVTCPLEVLAWESEGG